MGPTSKVARNAKVGRMSSSIDDEMATTAIDLLAEQYGRDPDEIREFLGAEPSVRRIVADLRPDPLGGDRPTAGPAGDPIRAAVDAATRTGI